MPDLPEGYRIVEGVESMDFAAIAELLLTTYWAKHMSFEDMRRAAQGSSLVVAAYFGDQLVGYLRVVSDRATFGWVSDVIVHPDHRGKGLARAMTQYALDHPEHQGFRRWVLATRDAHSVYRACGFEIIENPERWMIYHPPGSIGYV